MAELKWSCRSCSAVEREFLDGGETVAPGRLGCSFSIGASLEGNGDGSEVADDWGLGRLGLQMNCSKLQW